MFHTILLSLYSMAVTNALVLFGRVK